MSMTADDFRSVVVHAFKERLSTLYRTNNGAFSPLWEQPGPCLPEQEPRRRFADAPFELDRELQGIRRDVMESWSDSWSSPNK